MSEFLRNASFVATKIRVIIVTRIVSRAFRNRFNVNLYERFNGGLRSLHVQRPTVFYKPVFVLIKNIRREAHLLFPN